MTQDSLTCKSLSEIITALGHDEIQNPISTFPKYMQSLRYKLLDIEVFMKSHGNIDSLCTSEN